MPDSYSVIAVGGGHNGLYLCGAGTAQAERLPEPLDTTLPKPC